MRTFYLLLIAVVAGALIWLARAQSLAVTSGIVGAGLLPGANPEGALAANVRGQWNGPRTKCGIECAPREWVN